MLKLFAIRRLRREATMAYGLQARIRCTGVPEDLHGACLFYTHTARAGGYLAGDPP